MRAHGAHSETGRGGQGGRLLTGMHEAARTHAGPGGTWYEDEPADGSRTGC